MKSLVPVVALAALSASTLLATPTNVFVDYRPPNPNSEVFNGVDADISPFAASVGSNATGMDGNRSVWAFCNDFADDAEYFAGWLVNLTEVDSSDLSKTRFGMINPNPNYASGSILYKQIAWLFTQMLAPDQSIPNQDAIQEAVWVMTSGSDDTPKLTAGATGADKSYLQWISLAEDDYSSELAAYLTPDYSKWVVLTDVTAAGNTSGIGKQELLAYYTADGLPVTEPLTETPEPASFVLLGTAVSAVVLARRRGMIA